MLRRTRAFTALGAVGASTALVLGTMQGAASADPQARPNDVVAVGSDTVQYAADFLADGDVSGDNGFNNLQANRIVSEFATGDGNGRALYDSNGLLAYTVNGTAKTNGTSTIVLRAGQKPVTRPDGSGDGYAALEADSVGSASPGNYEGLPNNSINFARASRLPNSTEISTCDTNSTGCGGLHVYQFATDQLEMAVYSGPGGSNAPALSAQELVSIYEANTCPTWSTIPGYAGPAPTHQIIAVIPQSGSGTRNFFLADLDVAAGLSPTATFPLGTCAVTSEEHDPTGITHAVSLTPAQNTVSNGGHVYDPADAIEPFSAGRINLINTGYFANSGESSLDFQVKLNTGTPGDSNPIYDATRGLYFAVRQVDIAGVTTPMEPGGTKNFIKTLFDDGGTGSTTFIGRSSSAGLIAAAGLTQAYKNCGVDPTTC
jgi:ABC-type phosphate transport system substrate-binding protein